MSDATYIAENRRRVIVFLE